MDYLKLADRAFLNGRCLLKTEWTLVKRVQFIFSYCYLNLREKNFKHGKKHGTRENDLRKRTFLKGLILMFFKTEGDVVKKNEHKQGLIYMVCSYFDFQSRCQFLNMSQEKKNEIHIIEIRKRIFLKC